jgi:AcrR family transcriptional regulator
MTNKEIQTMRVMTYFIDATAQIIEEEGIENITIRKVADLAGYNSATIYNYFGELSHLIFFASMKFLKPYTKALPEYMSHGKNPLERYLLLWECFCKFSFKNPHIYFAIFSSDLGDKPHKMMQEYYEIFPNDLLNIPEDLIPMILESNISERDRMALEKCIDAGLIKKENAAKVNEMNLLVWQGMLTQLLNHRVIYSAEEASKITMMYIEQIIRNANEFKFD